MFTAARWPVQLPVVLSLPAVPSSEPALCRPPAAANACVQGRQARLCCDGSPCSWLCGQRASEPAPSHTDGRPLTTPPLAARRCAAHRSPPSVPAMQAGKLAVKVRRVACRKRVLLDRSGAPASRATAAPALSRTGALGLWLPSLACGVGAGAAARGACLLGLRGGRERSERLGIAPAPPGTRPPSHSPCLRAGQLPTTCNGTCLAPLRSCRSCRAAAAWRRSRAARAGARRPTTQRYLSRRVPAAFACMHGACCCAATPC